jgi:hypothetical protein
MKPDGVKFQCSLYADDVILFIRPTTQEAYPGHEIPKTEYRTESTENRTESTETEIFGTLFGSQFPGTEFTEVYSVLYLGLPNLPNLPKCVDCECCYVNDCTIVDYYIM